MWPNKVTCKKGANPSGTMMVCETTLHLKGEPLMNYVGIDYHKKYSVVTAVDEKGQVIRTTRLDNGSSTV